MHAYYKCSEKFHNKMCLKSILCSNLCKKLKEFRSIRSYQMQLPQDNQLSHEREVTLALGQPLPWGSSLSPVHTNRPLLSINFSVANIMKLSPRT